MARHVSENAINGLLSLGEEAGFGWRRYSIRTRTTDELLNTSNEAALTAALTKLGEGIEEAA